MIDKCKKEEPKVINSAMLEHLIDQQGPTGEAGRLARLEGTPFDQVEQLHIEFLTILRIDHLWMLTSLRKLSLSNNLIEKIENLDALINLVELDLSFNKIAKIENLDLLVNLEFLSLFDNKITKLENMNYLKKLIIFSVGNNAIEDRDNVTYLRRFKELQSVNMSGNPCALKDDFVVFVSTCLPQITYYQYKKVSEDDRTCGVELHSELLKKVEAEEEVERQIADKIQAEIEEAEFHAGSFVEFLGSRHLFDQMFETDEEGKAMLLINKEVRQMYADFEEQFLIITKRIFEVGQQMYKVRKEEVDQFFDCVNTAKLENQKYSIDKMEEFLVSKAKVFKVIKRLEWEYDEQQITLEELNDKLQVHADAYNDTIHKIWKTLMGLESTLYEQMEEIIQMFEQTITEQINVFVECAQGYFTELRTLEQTYIETVTVEANAFQTLSTLQENFYVPEELKVIMSEKDVLANALGATHDLHLLVIDTREDRLVNNARTWLSNLVGGLTRDEIMRSRDKVLEINHFLDVQREEFDDLPAFSFTAVTIDPDISAALN